ncbi:DUF4333 domain-containing protein [Nocardioides sp. CFH 31398]|uniref:DUF4333 domain-containing protein n=1 Tax=Nocardioides sp. CFH 31398 TaxID=2919579 RepID=UPI001F063141|nr:DUF4333 domain-containing protein [Nocardioides sp. CFH 31398]MCH1865416.1 DUF4333 domain-containing protein [Nocardioides sp. CFH 31398]
MGLPTRTAGAVVLAGVLVGALAGCGRTVDEDDVVDEVSAVVEDASGSAPDGVDCPDALDAEEGATTTCEVSVDGTTYDTDVEVTGVEGDSAEFDVIVPDDLRLPRVAAEDVEQEVASQVAAQVGSAPDGVSCPEDLPAEVGATITCTLVDGEDEYDTSVEVTEVDGTDVNFFIQVADEPNA